MKRFKQFIYFVLVFGILNSGILFQKSAAEAADFSAVMTIAENPEKNGWVNTNAGTEYWENGVNAKGLTLIGTKTYVFNAKGILQINKWTYISGTKYCSDSKGVLVRDKLVQRSGYYFYVTSDGTALKNDWKVLSNGKTCYFGANGARYTGVHKIGEKTYGFSINAGYLMRDKWLKVKSKVYRTNASGEILKDTLVKVDGNIYYLGSNGVRYINKWKTFPEGKSYFNAKGCRVTGEQKIGKKIYYFTSKGYLETEKTLIKNSNYTYYLDGKGVVEMKVKKGSPEKYYSGTGEEMTAVQSRNYLTLQTAKGIVNQITNSSMSQEQKLRACFNWVIKKPYVTRRKFSNFDGWPAVFANDHFLYGGGNCHSDAGAFAYLAKALGYKDVYVCTDAPGLHGEGHSWCEIGGRVYDPLFAEAKKNDAIYYGGTYQAYVLYPILHIAI